MKKIYNPFKRFEEGWKCPECGSEKVSLAVDCVIGYWYAFCEACGERGPEKDLVEFDEK